MQLVNIPIRDDFDNPEGRFRNYDAAPIEQREQILKQKHVDLRTFDNNDVVARMPMLYLDLLSMTTLDTRTMADLNGSTVVRRGEQWTQGLAQKDLDRNNQCGLTLSCTAGSNVTQSVITIV